jgi:hypothetical protein
MEDISTLSGGAGFMPAFALSDLSFRHDSSRNPVPSLSLCRHEFVRGLLSSSLPFFLFEKKEPKKTFAGVKMPEQFYLFVKNSNLPHPKECIDRGDR